MAELIIALEDEPRRGSEGDVSVRDASIRTCFSFHMQQKQILSQTSVFSANPPDEDG